MNFKVSRTFDRIWEALHSKLYRYIVNSGGSRSGKTYSIIQMFIIILMVRKNYQISCYRNLRVDCIDTIGKDIDNILDSVPFLRDKFVKNKKDATWTCKRTGSVIILAGTEKIHKALGAGNHIVFLNEISEFSQDVFNQLDQRCRDFIVIDYNPSKDFWIEKYRNNPKAKFLHSTYKDNIKFLTPGIVNKLESYNPFKDGSTYVEWKDGKGTLMYKGGKITAKNQPPQHELNVAAGTADRYMYEVYCLGLGSEKPNRIYRNWKTCSLLYFESLEFELFRGLDFGISKPTAMVEVKFDGDRTFYVNQSLYKPSREMGIAVSDYLINIMNIDTEEMIVADSAKATQVQDLRDAGLYAIDALKGSGSIGRGITQVQGFNIVYTKNSYDLESEYMEYSYKMDRYGLVTDDVDPRSEDHLMDALRYIISYLVKYLSIYTE